MFPFWELLCRACATAVKIPGYRRDRGWLERCFRPKAWTAVAPLPRERERPAAIVAHINEYQNTHTVCMHAHWCIKNKNVFVWSVCTVSTFSDFPTDIFAIELPSACGHSPRSTATGRSGSIVNIVPHGKVTGARYLLRTVEERCIWCLRYPIQLT